MSFIFTKTQFFWPLQGTFKTNVSSVLGQNTFNHHQQSQFKPVSHHNQFTYMPDRNNVLCSLSGRSDSNTICNLLANQSDPDTIPTSESNMDVREMDQTTDHANGSKDSERMSREDAKNNQEPRIAMKDRGDGKVTDRIEERRGHPLQKPKYWCREERQTAGYWLHGHRSAAGCSDSPPLHCTKKISEEVHISMPSMFICWSRTKLCHSWGAWSCGQHIPGPHGTTNHSPISAASVGITGLGQFLWSCHIFAMHSKRSGLSDSSNSVKTTQWQPLARKKNILGQLSSVWGLFRYHH